MKDKLAEEIIKQSVVEVEGLDGIEYVSHELAIHCMQAYHEAKMREVTDDDIISYAKSNIKSSIPLVEAGIIVGAKDLRDGKIKHNREV